MVGALVISARLMLGALPFIAYRFNPLFSRRPFLFHSVVMKATDPDAYAYHAAKMKPAVNYVDHTANAGQFVMVCEQHRNKYDNRDN